MQATNSRRYKRIKELHAKGLSYQQIATVLDVSINLVMSRFGPDAAETMDYDFIPAPTTIMTDSLPQTPERIDVYRRRIAAGEELFCDADPGNTRFESLDYWRNESDGIRTFSISGLRA